MVPQPCLAVLMLFPVTADSERAKADGEQWAEQMLWYCLAHPCCGSYMRVQRRRSYGSRHISPHRTCSSCARQLATHVARLGLSMPLATCQAALQCVCP